MGISKMNGVCVPASVRVKAFKGGRAIAVFGEERTAALRGIGYFVTDQYSREMNTFYSGAPSLRAVEMDLMGIYRAY